VGDLRAVALVSFVFLRCAPAGRWPLVTRADDTLVGEVAVTRDALAPGANAQIELRGTTWSARNTGDVALASGDRARVERVEGLHTPRSSRSLGGQMEPWFPFSSSWCWGSS
jgi:membrane protein implicated in regulation of membrane protease activity